MPDNWVEEEASLFDLMRFPKHRQPSNISNYERLITYAVGKRKIFAAQRRAGAIRIQRPYGPPGSVTQRWPHEMEVETFAYVANLRDAPEPSVEFMEKYRKQFWNGSHWLIADDEYGALEDAIIRAGSGVSVPPPPWVAPTEEQISNRAT